MICARCAADTPKSPCSSCGASPYLGGRYRLEERLSLGAASATYRAVEILGRQRVVLTEYPLQGELTDEHRAGLDAITAKLLSVEHRGIPKIVESFAGESAAEPAWWVARAWVDGAPLSERIERGPTDERAAQDRLDDVLSILNAYHMAGMAHGRVGPDTLLERTDGSLVLVDPAAVSDYLLTHGLGGDESLPAWAAPEEGTSGPSERADLFRVGMVTASLLAGRAPRYLRRLPSGVGWDGKNNTAPAFAALIDELTQADPEARAESTGRAIAALKAAQDNPASLVGITSSWDEYEPELTPRPAPGRSMDEPSPEPLDPSMMETVESIPPTASSQVAVAPSPTTPAPVLQTGPRLGGGPLPIGMPERSPPQSGGSGWMVGLGCAAVFILSLVGGIGLGGAAMLSLGEPGVADVADIAPVPPVEPSSAAPEPDVVPVPAPDEPAPQADAAAPTPTPRMLLDGPSDPDLGLMRIRCERRALVSINGRVVDRTPLDLELQPGEYEVTATLDEMPDWRGRQLVTLVAGELERIDFNP